MVQIAPRNICLDVVAMLETADAELCETTGHASAHPKRRGLNVLSRALSVITDARLVFTILDAIN